MTPHEPVTLTLRLEAADWAALVREVARIAENLAQRGPGPAGTLYTRDLQPVAGAIDIRTAGMAAAP